MHVRRQSAATTGLLLSGGLDSAILLAELASECHPVQPFYIQTGSIWQTEERTAVIKFIEALNSSYIQPVIELQMPTVDLYGSHWSTTGQDVPDETTTDEAVFLWGRNPLLLVKAMLWCSRHDIPKLALATLRNNPFADAQPQFIKPFQQSLTIATGIPVEIIQPFAQFSKQQVLAKGKGLPLQLTFSCLAPIEGKHCGQCNKCAERRQGLSSLPEGDATLYANELAKTP